MKLTLPQPAGDTTYPCRTARSLITSRPKSNLVPSPHALHPIPVVVGRGLKAAGQTEAMWRPGTPLVDVPLGPAIPRMLELEIGTNLRNAMKLVRDAVHSNNDPTMHLVEGFSFDDGFIPSAK